MACFFECRFEELELGSKFWMDSEGDAEIIKIQQLEGFDYNAVAISSGKLLRVENEQIVIAGYG